MCSDSLFTGRCVGAQVLRPCGVAFGADVVAVGLGVLRLQVPVFVCQHLPQVEEVAVLFHRNCRHLIVDAAEPVPVQPLVPCPGTDLRAHRRDGLHIDGGPRQRLGDHVQHQPVIGQKAVVIHVPPQHVGAQQNVYRLGFLGGQRLQRHLYRAVGTLAAGAVDDGVGSHSLIGAELCPRQTGIVHLHPLGQAVTHKAHVRKPAFIHRLGLGQSCHAEIQRRLGTIRQGAHRDGAGGLVAEGVPAGVVGDPIQNGVLLQGGRDLFPVETLPHDADGSQKDQKEDQGHRHDPSTPPPVQDPAPVFLIICHTLCPPFPARGAVPMPRCAVIYSIPYLCRGTSPICTGAKNRCAFGAGLASDVVSVLY